MIRLGHQLAFPVGANGGKGKQFFTVPDHKESLVAKSCHRLHRRHSCWLVPHPPPVPCGRRWNHCRRPMARQPVATVAAVRIRNCLRFMFMAIPLKFFASRSQNSNTRLVMMPQCKSARAPSSIGKTNPSPGRGWIEPMVLRLRRNPRLPRRLLWPGSSLFNCVSPVQFKHGDELLHTGQWQFLVRNRVAENKAVFKRLQAAVISAAEERGTAKDGLEGEMFAQPSDRQRFWERARCFC